MDFRKTLSIIIIAAGVVISISIASSTGEDPGGVSVASPEGEDNTSLDFNSEKKDSSLLRTGDSESDSQGKSTSREDNLTDFLAKTYANKVFEENGQFEKGESLDVPSSESINEIEEEILGKIKESFKIDLFTEEDIVISTDNSVKNQVAYLKAIGRASSENFSDFNKGIFEVVEEWMASKGTTVSDLRKYSEVASRQVNSLLEIEVPLPWKEFHLKNLNFWRRKQQLMEVLLETKEDALKSMIAIKKLPELAEYNQSVGESFTSSYQELMKKYNKQ